MALDDHPALAEAHRRLERAAELLRREAEHAGTGAGRISLRNGVLAVIDAQDWIARAVHAEERGESE